MEKQLKYLTQEENKKYIGKIVKLSLQEHMILQFLDMLHLIQ